VPKRQQAAIWQEIARIEAIRAGRRRFGRNAPGSAR
jgi:hypothetical protein